MPPVSTIRFALLLTLAAASGCARVSAPLGDNPGGAAPLDLAEGAADLTAMSDLGMPATPGDRRDLGIAADLAIPADLAARADLTLVSDLASPPDLTVVPACHLVINEVQTGTTQTGTDEFVELFNPCAAAIAVDSYKLVYRAAANTNPASGADSATLVAALGGSIAAGGYRVYGGSGFSGAADGTLASGIAASGAVGLRDAAGALVDSVAYGSVVAGNAFIETAAAPLPPTVAAPGGSIERLPNGADRDDNSRDFSTASASTPGAANR